MRSRGRERERERREKKNKIKTKKYCILYGIYIVFKILC